MRAHNGRRSLASTERLDVGVPRPHMSGEPAFGCQVAADPFVSPPAEMQERDDEGALSPALCTDAPILGLGFRNRLTIPKSNPECHG